MKKPVDRSTAPSDAADGDDTPPRVDWATRAAQINGTPFDAAAGTALFAQHWAADSHARTLDADEIARLSSRLQFIAIPAHQEVIGQDEQGDYLLVVLEGRVAVDRVQPDGQRVRLADAHAGDMLGEMSLLDAGARFSACRTVGPCVLAVLEADRLDEMMRDEPRLAQALLASLARRLSLRLRQVSARLSALLSGG